MTEPEKSFSLHLFGRYYAALSILPYFLAALVLFFLVCLIFVTFLFQDGMVGFRIVLVPCLLGSALLAPFLAFSFFIIRWHGKRRIELDNSGITMVFPNGKSAFVPWEFLLAVELRFSSPRLVNCTLVAAAVRFSFNNLEINLEERVPFNQVFEKGFGLEKTRNFLYYLQRRVPHLTWRTSTPFQERFKIFNPPYDLEKLK